MHNAESKENILPMIKYVYMLLAFRVLYSIITKKVNTNLKKIKKLCKR